MWKRSLICEFFFLKGRSDNSQNVFKTRFNYRLLWAVSLMAKRLYYLIIATITPVFRLNEPDEMTAISIYFRYEKRQYHHRKHRRLFATYSSIF